MINHLRIRNYKSIKDLDIATKRVNVFIGEHNSGKSNILEALSWFSINAFDQDKVHEIFRFKNPTDFFYDFDTSKSIEVNTDELNLIIRYAKNDHGTLQNEFEGLIYPSVGDIEALKDSNWSNLKDRFKYYCVFKLPIPFEGKIGGISGQLQSSFRTYIYRNLKQFQRSFRPFLDPPFGENIPYLLISNKNYKDLVSAIFKEKGFRLMIKPNEGDINMAKDIDDELYAYPYTSISETIQRIVFFMLAIESNKNAILILDEPESNTFPMYTKQLAESIALDDSNQYFLATHDPYVLGSLLSKTPSDHLSIFITKMDDYETKVTKVDEKELSSLLDKGADIYFNLSKFIAE